MKLYVFRYILERKCWSIWHYAWSKSRIGLALLIFFSLLFPSSAGNTRKYCQLGTLTSTRKYIWSGMIDCCSYFSVFCCKVIAMGWYEPEERRLVPSSHVPLFPPLALQLSSPFVSFCFSKHLCRNLLRHGPNFTCTHITPQLCTSLFC